jgi:undecaprenyl-diphosphatase
MRLVTAFGYVWVVTPLLLLAAYIFYRKNLKLSALLLVISVPGAALSGIFLKSLYERARPELFETGYTATFYSFPSGHAVTAVSFYGVLTLLVARRFEFGRRWTITAAGISLVLLIGFSRLYFGVHYPSDVVAGYLVATTWGGAVGTVLVSWRSIRRHQKGDSPP